MLRINGQLKLQVRRYRCTPCGTDIASRFLFQGLVFDTKYFREKMIEHRERTTEQLERVREMLAESRSDHVALPGADLEDAPGLVGALADRNYDSTTSPRMATGSTTTSVPCPAETP